MKRLVAVVFFAGVAGLCGVQLLRALVDGEIDGPRRGLDLVTSSQHPGQFWLMFATYCVITIGALVIALELARK